MTRLLRVSLLLVLLAGTAVHAKTPVARGTGGAAATISEQATQSAMTILDQGGNAVDAAVAAAATLGVTDPFSCGIGGGGFMVVYLAKDQRVITIDHREMAPAATTPTLFIEDGKEMVFDTAVASGLSIGVPGTVRGWDEALRRYGTMSLGQVLAPAIKVADEGFTVDANFSHLVERNERKFTRFPATASLYLRNGKAIPAGTRLRNPDLARTYRLLARDGADAFYEGPLARAIIDTINQPPTAPGVSVRGSRMTLADLANYEARLRLPVHSTYRGYDLYGMPLPSSGGVAVFEALNLLEGYDLASLPRTQVEHLYLEASRLAFADRDAYLADPEFVDAPVAGLLSKHYAAQRRSLIDASRAASGPVTAGDPYPFQQDPSQPLRPSPRALQAESAHTTHLTVSDKGYGFLLNNELTDFDFTPPHPNIPEPGKRPRSSMAPTIALKDGKPAFSIGSPGGSTIITTVLQTIVNHIDLGMPMDQAIDAPRLSQRNGDVTDIEPGFAGRAQAEALAHLGQRWSDQAEEIGAANALVFNADGTVTAVSEGHRHGVGSAQVQAPVQNQTR
ncbi:MAG: gamma-glutamyltransferase [Stenotrophomonas acidaminiphila]|nr:MAG: gamma-glutamyltransferase [Stenotrophomonas acidaminiphila]